MFPILIFPVFPVLVLVFALKFVLPLHRPIFNPLLLPLPLPLLLPLLLLLLLPKTPSPIDPHLFTISLLTYCYKY